MKSGWRGESYRHYLAAKGVKTTNRSYAKKPNPLMKFVEAESRSGGIKWDTYGLNDDASSSPVLTPQYDPLKESLRSDVLTKREEERIRSRRKFNQAISDASAGSPDLAIRMVQDPSNPLWADELSETSTDAKGKTISQVDSLKISALKNALNARALQLAQAGVPIDPALRKVVDSSVLSRADQIQKFKDMAAKREFESPIKRELREKIIPEVEAGLISAAPEGILAGKQAWDDLAKLEGKGGLLTNAENLRKSPGIQNNAAVGWEEQSKRGVWDDIEGTRLRSSWDDVWAASSRVGPGSVNPLLSSPPPQQADIVQKRIDSIFSQKNEFANADFTPYDEGRQAFKQGNREKLINNVLELQREEAKMQNRNKIIDQAMADLNSKENYATAFRSGNQANFLFSDSKGAEKLNDQIKKLHEVKGEVAKRHNELFTRRRLLQQNLIRLDSQITPIFDIPTNSPKTIESKSVSGWMAWKDKNPSIELFKSANPFNNQTE
jgi:hypothetical protein